MEGHTSAVLSYISFCTESVTTTKTVKVFPNQKPWLNSEVRALLRARDSAFKSGDQQVYKEARQSLVKGIKEAKRKYKQRIEEHFNTKNSRNMWQGIKTLTGYKDSCTQTNSPDILT